MKKIDLTFKEATRNLQIPFAVYEPDINSSKDAPLLDAVYVPLQVHRPPLETDIHDILCNTKNLYLLYSDKSALWAQEINDDRVYIYMKIF